MLFGVFSSAESAEAVAFIQAAGLGEVAAAHTFDASVAARHGLQAPGVAVLKKAS